jgi:RNA polymerase sigma-70 factor (ECF subfamily)
MKRRAGVEAPARTIHFEDAVLVGQIQAGDVQAYAHLVSKYQDKVFNTCWRICGNPDDAADITQDALLKALESIGSFRGASSFYTWLFRIAVNLALSHRRKAARVRCETLNGPDESYMLTAWQQKGRVADDPAARTDDAEVRAHVAEALRTLDEQHRAAIVLRDIEGFDYDQIAEILNVPKGTVKSRIARGRQALREAMGPYVDRDG